jgi:hypothetical protein
VIVSIEKDWKSTEVELIPCVTNGECCLNKKEREEKNESNVTLV